MSLYNDCVCDIRKFSEEKQTELDKLAREAREANIQSHRAAALDQVNENSPEYSVCNLVANTLSIGREDGFLAFNIPQETKNVILAALNAGILKKLHKSIRVGNLLFSEDASGLSDRLDSHFLDYNAWKNAQDYKNNQTWKQL